MDRPLTDELPPTVTGEAAGDTTAGSLPSAARDDAARRAFDLVMAAAGLLVLSPLLLVLGLCVKLQDRGPIFFTALRVGRGGRLFRLYKFRTMVVNADRLGSGITTRGDRRVTRFGRWLRRTKLDELPQLLNVLIGDMSLVGPRPEDPRYVALYTPAQRRVLAARPGITSAASVAYRHEEQMLAGADSEQLYRDRVLQEKLAIDLAYLDRRSLGSDLVIIGRTFAALFH